jgi:hypothetical protein
VLKRGLMTVRLISRNQLRCDLGLFLLIARPCDEMSYVHVPRYRDLARPCSTQHTFLYSYWTLARLASNLGCIGDAVGVGQADTPSKIREEVYELGNSLFCSDNM